MMSRKLRNKAITSTPKSIRAVIEFEFAGNDYLIEVKPEHYRQMVREGKINP